MYGFKSYKTLGYLSLIVLFFLSGELLKFIPGVGDTIKSFSTLNSAFPEYEINLKNSTSGYITITATGSISAQLSEEERSILAEEMAKVAISSNEADYKSITVIFVTQNAWKRFFGSNNTDVYYHFAKGSFNT